MAMSHDSDVHIDFSGINLENINSSTYFRSWSSSPLEYKSCAASDIEDLEMAQLLHPASQLDLEVMLAQSLRLDECSPFVNKHQVLTLAPPAASPNPQAFSPRCRSTPPVLPPDALSPFRVLPVFLRLANTSLTGLEEEEEVRLNEEVAHFMARYGRALDRWRTPSRLRPRNPLSLYLLRRCRRPRPQSEELFRCRSAAGHKLATPLLWRRWREAPADGRHSDSALRHSLLSGDSPLDRLHNYMLDLWSGNSETPGPLPQFRHRPEISSPPPARPAARGVNTGPSEEEEEEVEDEVEVEEERGSRNPVAGELLSSWGSRPLLPSVTSAFEPLTSTVQR